MNPIRRKMASLMAEAIHNQIETLSTGSEYAKDLHKIHKIGDVKEIITDETTKICKEATLGEITKVSRLLNRVRKVTKNEQEIIKEQLNRIAKKLIKRVEDKTGPLKLSKVCLELFSQL